MIGRGRADGASLIRDHFAELQRAADHDEDTAYVFVMGSMAEVLRVFDFHLLFPEITSLQTAVRKQSLNLLNKAEDYGYSPDVCGYVKADVGVHLSDREHPMGKLPKPNLAIAVNTCNTYIKWAEIWERIYGSPTFVLDIPGMRSDGRSYGPGHPEFESDRRYVQNQITELFEICERITKKPFKMDKLIEIMDRVNRMAVPWSEIIKLNQHTPAPFNSMTDGLTYMGMINALRGTEAGVTYMENLRDELKEKIRLGIGAVQKERFRLVFVGTACYSNFRRFTEFFEEWGGIFVSSEYNSYAAGGIDQGIVYDLSRPLESLAEQLLYTGQKRMSSIFFSHNELAQIFKDFKADGVVYHAVKSCRTVSTGMADSREFLIRNHGIPALLIESDLVDPRVFSEAQMKNRIDAFFESLDSKRALAGKQ